MRASGESLVRELTVSEQKSDAHSWAASDAMRNLMALSRSRPIRLGSERGRRTSAVWFVLPL
jgi:hypothetical protein